MGLVDVDCSAALNGNDVDNLWTEVGICFDTDDGSLPGIEVSGLSPDGVAGVYAMLRHRSRLCGDSPEFWSLTDAASIHVDSVPNAAAIVAAGEAEPFHHCIEGVTACGAELPVLGVFVWPDAVELDYRMGPSWGPRQVAGLFELLRECMAFDVGAVVMPADFEGPPYPETFRRVWAQFLGVAS